MFNNEDNILSCVEVPANLPSGKSVIWLHGLGADASDFVPIVPELRLPADLPIRFIFPNAPVMPVTINNGYEMRAWYDITSLALTGEIDIEGIDNSTRLVQQLIEREIARGVRPENIVLGGFSQGAVMSLATGLRYEKPLGGILALSGYLPFTKEVLQATASPANKSIPIFLGHGTEDMVVPYVLGKATYAILQELDYNVTWHSYSVAHSVNLEEINDVSQWLQRVLR